MNDPTAKTTAERPGIEETAGLLNFRIAAWHDFGYVTPPTPDCKAIPPLGERSAEAIKAGHGAIEVIDEIVRDLYRLRDQLITELRTDKVRPPASKRASRNIQVLRHADPVACSRA